jgi:hypothetical protein
MATLAVSSSAVSSSAGSPENANSPMNGDIVKPMPATQPTPPDVAPADVRRQVRPADPDRHPGCGQDPDLFADHQPRHSSWWPPGMSGHPIGVM